MQPEEATSWAKILVNGSPLSEPWQVALQRVDVDLSLHMPATALIDFSDPKLELVNSATPFAIGAELEVKFKVSSTEDKPVFKGIVCALEPVFEEGHGYCTFAVRAYDKMFKLHRGRKSAAFTQMTDTDIVRRIASDAGLSVDAESTNETHESVFRDNMTDFEFVKFLANRNGFVSYFADDKLVFKKASSIAGDRFDVEYGVQCLQFRPIISLTGQPNSVEVRGWDRKTKKAAVGTSSELRFNGTKIGITQRGYEMATKALNGRTKLLVADSLTTTNSLKNAAEAIHDRLGSEDVTAEGTLLGEPDLKPGCTLRFKALSAKFDGDYFVTRVRHILDPAEAFHTQFWVGGMNTGTFSSLISENPGRNPVEPRRPIVGLMVGIVTDNKDPEGLFRVKVKFPTLDDSVESFWLPVVGAGAGNQRGFMMLPEVNDEVLIGFEHGDANRGYVLGGLWNKMDAPPMAQSSVAIQGNVEVREWKSRVGHVIRMTDKSGEEKIEVIDKTGKNLVKIDSKENTITITSDKDIVLEAKQGAIKLQAMNIQMKATQGFEVGSVQAKVEGKAALSLKGGQAELVGTGMAKVSGPTVMIN